MALLNNWDLKEVNNQASPGPAGEIQYRVADLGATFGRTGNSLTRTKGVAKDFAGSRFVEHITATHVDLGLHSRPFILSIFNVPNYRVRTRMEGVANHIPVADARWIEWIARALISAERPRSLV